MLESEADRLAALKQLGEKVTIDGIAVWGIFENAFLEALADPGVGVTSPEFTGRTSDLTDVRRDSVLERGTDSFRVREIEPDGTGMTLLRLRGG